MSNQIQTQTRIRVIADDLEKGISNAEIMREYSQRWNLAERTIERYIALAKGVVLTRIKNTDAVIEAVRGAVIAEEAEKQLRSTLELEAKLISILEGDMQTERIVTRHDGVTEVKSSPSRKEMMKVIEILFKTRGLYRAPKDSNDKEKTGGLPEIKVESEADKKLVEQIFKLP